MNRSVDGVADVERTWHVEKRRRVQETSLWRRGNEGGRSATLVCVGERARSVSWQRSFTSRLDDG
jgi:hypothetical protein